MLYQNDDTICAIATPSGEGAIAIIRVSGKNAVALVRNLASFLPAEVESHKVYYGHLKRQNTEIILDEVLVTCFMGRKSFTGEESVEISCHGSPAITQDIMLELVRSGARVAEKGEFTFRAFMNGRIDLAQAEAVLSLIQSQSTAASRQSLKLLQGEFSEQIKFLEDDLIWVISRLEANIDFSAEDIEFAPAQMILDRLTNAAGTVDSLLSSYKAGKILKSGLRLALVGAPNVGKSSLLNALTEQDRAIVSAVPGTTRDSIESVLDIEGYKIIIVDTAGLRLSTDAIELQGIARTLREIAEADLILFVYDATDLQTRNLISQIHKQDKTVIAIANKADLLADELKLRLEPTRADREDVLSEYYASATTKYGVKEIKIQIAKFIHSQYHENSTVVMSARQLELLSKTSMQLKRGIDLLKANSSPEFVIAETQEALLYCMQLTGKKFDDEVLDRVFRDFCLGK